MAILILIIAKLPFIYMAFDMSIKDWNWKRKKEERTATLSVADCLQETNRLLYYITYALIIIAICSH